MSTKLYMDVHVRRAVADGLRLRGVDVITAQEDRAAELDDAELLDRAAALGRVLFSQDDDLLREAKQRQQSGVSFGGLVYGHELNITIVQCISALELIAKASESDEWINTTVYIPF
jgi:predicted nuclease of predicted toxin-antitoxin system